MAKAENKTITTEVPVASFIDAIEHKTRKADAKLLLDLFAGVTGMSPKMWGPSMIGYGSYHYKYDSGREGESFLTGFSPRKANMVLYVMPGYEALEEQLSNLGKHKLGKSCLYINKLADVDIAVVRNIIHVGLDIMKSRYEWTET